VKKPTPDEIEVVVNSLADAASKLFDDGVPQDSIDQVMLMLATKSLLQKMSGDELHFYINQFVASGPFVFTGDKDE